MNARVLPAGAGMTLATMIHEELRRPVPAGAHALTARLREIFGPNLLAVVMYGSNLRRDDDHDGVLDLYALVTSYRSVYRNPALALANRLLPPNVFYLEAPIGPRIVRGKYAVLALDDLGRLTSARTAEPYFWVRFAQPCALLHAAGDPARDMVAAALADAVTTFVRFGVALAPGRFDTRELWTKTWRATYAAEIRPERSDAAAALYAGHAARFEQATILAMQALPWSWRTVVEDGRRRFEVDVPEAVRRRAARAWRFRRLQAKWLFLLRILRNALIFEGGVDYVLWKIERHSGVVVDQAWRKKRYRWLALGAEAWRLYRARAFR